MPSLVTVSQGTDAESGLDLEELMEPGGDAEELMEPELGPEIIIPGPLVVRQQMGGARRVVQLDQFDYLTEEDCAATRVIFSGLLLVHLLLACSRQCRSPPAPPARVEGLKEE